MRVQFILILIPISQSKQFILILIFRSDSSLFWFQFISIPANSSLVNKSLVIQY